MANLKLYYSELGSDSDIETLEFKSAKSRMDYIYNKVARCNPKRVFTLIIEHSEDYSSVYVFDKWVCIDLIAGWGFKEFWLYEWDSYEEAYKNALDIKEESPLCYSSKGDLPPLCLN